jgi:dTDP-glucose 4,6-dehydratase
VEGCLRLLDSTLAGPVNIGNPREVSVGDLAELICALSRVVYVPRPEDDPTVRRPDITLAREALGWEPQVDLADGLGRTIDWIRADVERETRRAG